MNTAIYFKRWLSLFLALLLTVGLNPPLWAQTPDEVGLVEEVQGEALVTPPGGQPQKAAVGMKIHQGDSVATQPGAKLRIRFVDESAVSLAADSQITIDQYVFDPAGQQRSCVLGVLWGKVRIAVNDLTGYSQKQFHVTTTTAIVGVRGTDFLVWAKTAELTQVASLVNAVDVAGLVDASKPILLEPGNLTQVMPGLLPSAPVKLTPAMIKSLLQGLLPADAVPPTIPEAGQAPAGPGAGEAATAAADAAGAAAGAASGAAGTASSTAAAAAAAAAAAGAAVVVAAGAVKDVYDKVTEDDEKEKTEEGQQPLEEAQNKPPAPASAATSTAGEPAPTVVPPTPDQPAEQPTPPEPAAAPAPEPKPVLTAAATPQAFPKPVLELRTLWKTFGGPMPLQASERKTREIFEKFRNSHPNAGASRFVDHGNGAVTDTAAGLMWQKDFSPKNMTGFAPGYAEDANKKQLGGFADWRLPTSEEVYFLYLSWQADPGLPIDMPPANAGLWSGDKVPITGQFAPGYAFAWYYKDIIGEGLGLKIPDSAGSYTYHHVKAVRTVGK